MGIYSIGIRPANRSKWDCIITAGKGSLFGDLPGFLAVPGWPSGNGG